jgi:hypothetical protein
MENIRVKCKYCNKELEGHSSKTICCGCPNMTTIKSNNNISAVNLSDVVMLNNISKKENKTFLTKDDIAWQESRRQRKVKKLDFEIR